jgi:aryl-phospho-beta-D-glucosidase BglC (GH1 family)
MNSLSCRRHPYLRYALALSLLVGLAPVAVAQSHFVHTDGTQLIDGTGHALMLRGTNLGNWLVREGYMFHFEGGPQSAREIEALTNELLGPEDAAKFWQQYLDRYITRDDIQFLQRAGFNSIRVPIHYKYFQSDDDEGFKLLDRVIEWSREAGLYIILDMHAAPGGQTGTNIDDSFGYPWLYDSPAAQQQLIDTWKRIARHYRDSETVLGYDLLNEPIPHFPELQKYNSQLEPLYKRMVAAIRVLDNNHVIILGGARWDTNFKVFGPPFDKNVMYNFHKYWMKPEQSEIQEYVDFRDKYHVPIWMSESGENTDEWITQFRELLEKNQIGWAFWPYKKMDSPRSVVSFAQPAYWDEIVAYAKLPGNTGATEKRITKRPPQEHINAAFAELLDDVQFRKCRINQGYLRALGLRVPD